MEFDDEEDSDELPETRLLNFLNNRLLFEDEHYEALLAALRTITGGGQVVIQCRGPWTTITIKSEQLSVTVTKTKARFYRGDPPKEI